MLRERLLTPRNTRRVAPRTPRMVAIDTTRMKAAVDASRAVLPSVDVERIKPRLERAVFGFGFVNPMLALPQIYNIFVFKHVAGLSLITIASALLMSLLWTAYGVLRRQTVVWATSAVWVILNGATLAGVAMFSR